MGKSMRPTPMSRREFMRGMSAAALCAPLASLVPGQAAAQAQQAAPEKTWQDVMKELSGGAVAAEGKISLDLPEIAENGNTVPFTVLVDSPMTSANFVRAVHLIATGNPRPEVASFYFSAMSGKAEATSRMRLNKTQDVIALAEMSDGKFFMGKKTIKVTIGGCGG